MIGRNLMNILRRTTIQPYHIPKKNFAQVGLGISAPPRYPCSYGEKVLHIAFLYVFWLTPVAYFLTQIKVWRREYVQS